MLASTCKFKDQDDIYIGGKIMLSIYDAEFRECFLHELFLRTHKVLEC